MKRLVYILFLAFYVSASTGIAVNIHYCSGHVEFVELIIVDGKCSCGDKGNADDCCDDETFFFQLDQAQQLTKNLKAMSSRTNFSEIFSFYTAGNYFPLGKKEVNFDLKDFLPPPKKHSWLVNCSLIYYG